jgi:flagellar motor switch protein FliM
VRGDRRPRAARTPEPYDFSRPTALSREHNRTLQIAFDAFARQTTTVLTSTLRTVSTVSLDSVEQRSYGEFVASLPHQTYLSMLSLEPITGVGLLDMPLAGAMTCLDHMLGGPGGADQPDRPLTEMEDTLVRGLFSRLLSELIYAFEFVRGWEPGIIGVEYSPQFAQAMSASDPVVVATFEVVVGETTHPMSLCLPLSGLLPYLVAANRPGDVSAREQELRRKAAVELRRTFDTVPVDVAVHFRPTSVDPAVLVDLAVGDVIRLNHPAAAPLDVTAGQVVFAHATPGTKGRRLACLVASLPDADTTNSSTALAIKGHQ